MFILLIEILFLVFRRESDGMPIVLDSIYLFKIELDNISFGASSSCHFFFQLGLLQAFL